MYNICSCSGSLAGADFVSARSFCPDVRFGWHLSELGRCFFYKNAQGVEPVAEYVRELAAKSDKDSRIKLNKIREISCKMKSARP